jgi:peptide/nickel transport system substrate-binding protein
MISPEAIKKGKEYCLANPVGTGPFKFKSFQRDQSVVFEKFNNYWQKGKPYLDRIEWIMISDKYTAVMSFKNGDGQLIWGLDPSDAADLSKQGNYIVTKTPAFVALLAGDSAHPTSPFADMRVRQAVDYAISKKEIAEAYPEVDPQEWQKFVLVRLKGNEVAVRELPLDYYLKPPYLPDFEENYQRHCGL